MAQFSSFANRLPDPNFGIAEDGSATGTRVTGPGFASVKFASQRPVAISRTNSGRVITRAIANQKWNINISYNPMTRDEFEPIHNFLLEYGKIRPFFISLPQYADTRTSGFTGTISVDGAISAGARSFTADGFSSDNASEGLRPGDMITFTDSSNSNHLKAYKIIKVLTNSNYLSGSQPNSGERIIYTSPPIEKAVSNDSTINFENVLIRVIMTSDVIEYDLGNNNLFQFSLQLEEAQP